MANDQPPRKPRPPLASSTSATSPSSRASTEADSISAGGKRTPHNPKTPDAKHSNRVLKRPSAARAVTDPRASETRYKRVWKACERCRMKKTKCDGENPCERCKNDGVMCTAGTRKKTEYKQVPNGYVELLENQSYQMQRTILKLYTMVREKQEWASEEPSFNKEGQPVIHEIARALGVGGHEDMVEILPENEEQANALIEKYRAKEAAEKGRGHLKRESIDDTPYMVRQHSDRHSEPDSDTSFSTEDQPSTLPPSTQPMRLVPKTLAPLQIDQMQYLPNDLTSASQFDEFYDPSYLTSPMYSDGFPSESPDEDMMWMDNPLNPISASQPPLTSIAIAPLSTTQAIPMAHRLDAMSSLGRINAFEASTVAGTRGGMPGRGLSTQEYIYGIGAPQNLGEGMGGIAGTGTIRPGMLEKGAPVGLGFEMAGNGLNGVNGRNSVRALDGPFSFKNFHTPQ